MKEALCRVRSDQDIPSPEQWNHEIGYIPKYLSLKALVICLSPKSSVQSVVCTASLPVGPLHSPRLTVPPSFRHSS